MGARLSHNLPLRNLHDQHEGTSSTLPKLQMKVRASRCLGLTYARKTPGEDSKHSWASTNVTRKLYFMTQTTHNSAKTATDNEDTTLARQRKEDAQDTAFPGCDREQAEKKKRSLCGLPNRLGRGAEPLQNDRDVNDHRRSATAERGQVRNRRAKICTLPLTINSNCAGMYALSTICATLMHFGCNASM